MESPKVVITRLKITTITLLFILWVVLETYWQHFLGINWGWYFKETYDNGKQIGYSAEWFMSDLSEELQGIISFLTLCVVFYDMALFKIRNISISVWHFLLAYSVWACYDYMLWQSQTEYVREVCGIVLIILLVVNLTKQKEDGV